MQSSHGRRINVHRGVEVGMGIVCDSPHEDIIA